MKIEQFIKKLNSSKEYKDFAGKNKDAFMIAGFFILDYEMGQNIQQIDYFVPSEKKVAAFTLGDKIILQMLETMMPSKKLPEALDSKSKIDIEELKGILTDEMKNRGITDEIKKIIAVVQNLNGKKIWNLNCVLSGMGLLKAHVEDESETVLQMEKISMTDIMKRVPPEMLQQLKDKAKASKEKGEKKGNAEKAGSKKEAKEEIKKLDKLKEAIEKEEKELKKKMAKDELEDDGEPEGDEEPDEDEPEQPED